LQVTTSKEGKFWLWTGRIKLWAEKFWLTALVVIGGIIIGGFWFFKELQEGETLRTLPLESLVFAGFTFGLVLLLLWQIPQWQIESKGFISAEKKLDLKDRLKLEDDLRKTVAQILAGGFVLFTIYTAIANLTVTQQGQLTTRFTEAIKLLGTKDTKEQSALQSRIGGIYALERIAQDSRRDHPQVMEVLTAFVRESTPNSNTTILRPIKIKLDVQTALTVIGRRVKEFDLPNSSLDLHNSNLNGAYLKEAYLNGADLNYTNLNGAYLKGADLTGAHLIGAHLNGDTYLNGAHLTGAHLNGAVMNQADLTEADLTEAYLSRAHLIGTHLNVAHLNGAHLTEAVMTGADLNGANLTGADLNRAFLDGADLSSTVGLTQAQINIVCSVDKFTRYPQNIVPPKKLLCR
jgi:hypothetical protein